MATPPTISGTQADQSTISEASIDPFAGVTIADPNAGATDVLTITLGGSGGVLSGAGLSGGAGGVYTLAGTAASITSNLDSLSFVPTAGAPGDTVKTTFTLDDVSTSYVGAATTLASFDGANGASPAVGLSQDAAGDLFGTTSSGGANGDGSVFEIPASTGVLTTLASFSGANGASPAGGLVSDAAGDLFGTTASGGASSLGTVFEYSVSTGAITTLASFDDTNGANPGAGLVRDAAGDLFGTTHTGGANGMLGYGTVFEISAATGALTTLANFDGPNGAGPAAGLIQDSAADLFGTTASGGANGDGTVFEIPASTGVLTTLASFSGANGMNPDGALLRDAAGDLFGTTAGGGAHGYGTVFELSAASGALTALASFNATNGMNPVGALVEDAAGDLFGTTSSGGANGDGTVFEIPAATGVLTTLANFSGANGAGPGGLILDAAGNLLGTTSSGGASSDGTVFKIPATRLSTVNATTSVADTNLRGGPTISGVTTAVQTTASEAPVTPFAGVTIADPNAGATETLTIAISGSGGTLSGAGTPSNGVFTLTGTASAVTTALRALTFTPVGQPDATSTSTFTLADMSSAFGAPVTNGATKVADSDPAVALSLSASDMLTGQTTTLETAIDPFASVTLADPNDGGADVDTLTIALSGSFLATSPFSLALTNAVAGVTLSGSGSSYQLQGTAAAITAGLAALAYTPTNGVPGTSVTTDFTLSATNPTSGTSSTTLSASVVDTDPPIELTITGTRADQTTTAGAPVQPFAGVTVADIGSGGATDALTITLGGSGGMLAGAGLSGGAGGVYTLAGTAASITGQLDALTFTPTAGAPGAASNTTFTLSDIGTSHVGAPKTLAAFDGANGATPNGLVIDASGDLFGTTQTGGDANGDGTVFEIPASTGVLTTIASFNGANGAGPSANLLRDAAGDLFGTTSSGGANGDGTVFEIPAATGVLTTLANFSGANGVLPESSLVRDAAGDLFGTTLGGGANGYGTVFEISVASGAITTLANFDGANGFEPYGGIALDAAGDLFGTTLGGTEINIQGRPQNAIGTVFEIPASTGLLTTLASFDGFDGANGRNPNGVIIDSAGDLFGTTETFGASDSLVGGTVFEIPAATGVLTTLANFYGPNGYNLEGTLLRDAAGNLFGTAGSGGANDDGIVFEIQAGSGTMTTLATFTGANGALSFSNVVSDAAGNLFGTTAGGGPYGDVGTFGNGYGTVFEIPVTHLTAVDATTSVEVVPTVTLTVQTPNGIDLSWPALYDELADSPIVGTGATATGFTATDTGALDGHTAPVKFAIAGTGLTYSGSFPNIQLTGGTITGIQEQDSSGNVLATFTNFLISAGGLQAALNSYATAFQNSGTADPTALNGLFLANQYQETGGSGADHLQGGNLADTFHGSAGNDTLAGGAGVDVADYSGLATPGIVAIVAGGSGTVNKGNSLGIDTLTGIESLIGGPGGDVFYVDASENVTGGGGFDYLIELTAGVNLSYGASFTGISEFVSNVGNNTVNFSAATGFVFVYGSIGNDTLTLGSGGGYLFGGGGANTLSGGANTVNFLVDSGGTNTMNGGTGSSENFFYVGDSNDQVNGAGAFNVLVELSPNATVQVGSAQYQHVQEVILNGGVNTVSVAPGDSDFVYLYGGAGNDTITTGAGGGYMFGGGGTNVLTGAAGATNIFIADDGAGIDTMNGGTGSASNIYYVDSHSTVRGAGAFNLAVGLDSGVTLQLGSAQFQDVQQVVLNGGTNTVSVAAGDTDLIYLDGGVGNDTLSTGSGGGYLLGGAGTNTLQGGGGVNVFVADGSAGIDTMNGGSGSNIYYIDSHSTVRGAGTFNTVLELQQSVSLALGSAQLGTDVQQVVLNGGINSADFSSATSAVFFYGGAGNDTLFGGTGNDFLYGGSGTNTFEFGIGWGQDTIEDWTAGTNSIIDITALAGLGVHATTDLTQTITGGNDVITSSHTGTNSITLLGVGSALTAGSFHFA